MQPLLVRQAAIHQGRPCNVLPSGVVSSESTLALLAMCRGAPSWASLAWVAPPNAHTATLSCPTAFLIIVGAGAAFGISS